MNPYPKQFLDLEVKEAVHKENNVIAYRLEPAGDKLLPGFSAGQYLSLQLEVDGRPVSRPYSICSSPADLSHYEIAVELVPDGTVTPWIQSHFNPGTVVRSSVPQGTRIHESGNVLAFAGGTGITPYLSMARAIVDGVEDFSLTILYGNKNPASILYGQELDTLCVDPRISVIHLFEEEGQYMDRHVIEKHLLPDSVLMTCGPKGMVDFVVQEAESLGLSVFTELPGELHVPELDWKEEWFTIDFNGTLIPASSRQTILESLEKAGIAHPSNCRSGECGWCSLTLVDGFVYPPATDSIHPCRTFPLSDLVLKA